MQRILPELANFQRDSSSAVRKFLAEFLATAAFPNAKAKPDPATLTTVLAVLHTLAGDEATAVVKTAITGCSKLFKPAFAAVAEGGRAPGGPGTFQQLWSQVLQVAFPCQSSVNALAVAGDRAAIDTTASRSNTQVLHMQCSHSLLDLDLKICWKSSLMADPPQHCASAHLTGSVEWHTLLRPHLNSMIALALK